MTESEMTMRAGHEALMEESPYRIQSKKLAMWLFIISDAVTFGAILFAYGYLRIASPDWTAPFAFSPTIVNGMIMTFVLLTSSLTMLGSVHAAQAARRSACLGWLGATMLLGVIVVALDGSEWSRMIGEGWRLFQNPLGGAVQFGAMFFSITGLHMLHVIAGIVALAVITFGFNRGRFDAGHVETAGLYWQFVSLLWMFVFPLVYLMNAR